MQTTINPARHRAAAILLALAVALTGILGATTASAAPETIENATFEWQFNDEVANYAPPFGGCNHLSAGDSDGTQAQYRATDGDVTILRAGVTPTWADKCAGAAAGALDQKVVWSGGTGTVDPETGAVSLEFTGSVSLNFYGGIIPFTIGSPTLTVNPDGSGTLVADVFGWSSAQENPDVVVPLDPVSDVTIATFGGADSANQTGFTVTPDYAGVEVDTPEGSPQNRSTPGWGAWPQSFVDVHVEIGLSSYWYSSGGAADNKKPPLPITVTYNLDGEGPGEPQEPGDDQQTITVVVPESTDPGEFLWTIDGSQSVHLGETTDAGTYLQATGSITPIRVTDTRAGGPEWTVSGQISDFTGGVSGSHLGWSPEVLTAGAGAVAGEVIASGIDGGDGLSVPAILAAAIGGHPLGTAVIGADLDLRLPVNTDPGAYTATLTITALS